MNCAQNFIFTIKPHFKSFLFSWFWYNLNTRQDLLTSTSGTMKRSFLLELLHKYWYYHIIFSVFTCFWLLFSLSTMSCILSWNRNAKFLSNFLVRKILSNIHQVYNFQFLLHREQLMFYAGFWNSSHDYNVT